MITASKSFREVKLMHKRVYSKVCASFLLLAMWIGTFGTLSAFAQTSAPPAKPAKEDKKSKDQKQEAAPAQTAQQNNPNRPLDPNENPAMIGKRNINKGFVGWLGGSQEKEISLGRQVAMQVEQEAKFVDDPIVTEYINRVGQNLVLHSDAKVPFTIKVIDSDEINAFALPGGFFFVNKGLILAADNEAEVAGVMAHEIAHVAARHAVENAGKNQLLGYGMLAGMIFGGPIAGAILQNGGGILQGLAFLKFSRGSESEADRLGVQYMYAAGYDPTAMATMFEKLAAQNKKKPSALLKLFATHPQPVDRRENTLSLISRFPEREEYVISSSEFQRVKARLLRLSNARASATVDLDENGNTRPTLKRRSPEPEEGDTPKDTPPTLKKGSEDKPASDQPAPEKKP
jgi:Zn-dependent protease with chaperone function